MQSVPPVLTEEWRQCMNLVSILLQFVRAIRGGILYSYQSSFAAMLSWFAAYYHGSYLRWGCVFLVDMKHLEYTVPEIYHGFQSGDFISKE